MSKTNIAMKSTYISIIVFIIQGSLTFWRTNVIITTYGVNINSIVQASGDVFSYLVLLESGLGAAYLFKMYKPVSDKNYNKVYSLFLGLQKKLRRVAIYMAIILLFIAIIYPFVLGDNDVPFFKSFLIILILGLRFVFPYYFTLAIKNILKAEEKQYVVTFIDGIINSVILMGEIALALWLEVSIELALSIGLILVVISYYIYYNLLEKNHTYSTNETISPSFDGDEMTNDIIIHQIASLANSHIDIFILSLIDLPAVTIYSAYNLAISYPVRLVGKIVENIRASIGLKLSENHDNMYSVFRELMSLNYFIAAITIPLFVIMINDFISLWIGEEFLLGTLSIILFALILFHRLTINLIYIIRDGRALYKESKVYTIFTAIINVVLSVILANYFSINGLLIATVLTSYFIMDLGNLKLVYTSIFNKSLLIVLKDYISLLIIISLSIYSTYYVINNFLIIEEITIQMFLLKSFITLLISLSISVFTMLFSHNSFKKVVNRLIISLYRK